MTGGVGGASRSPRRLVLALLSASLVGSLMMSACGGSGGDGSTGASGSPASEAGPRSTAVGTSALGPEPGSKAAIEATAKRLFPPAPDPKTADVAEEHCTGSMAGMPGMADDMGLTESTDFTEQRGDDGSYEHVFGGVNPRIEVSAVPFDTPATPEQRAAATAFVQEVANAIERHGWNDPKKAAAQGFRPMQMCATHWVSVENALDGKVLDPDHPEFLVIETDAAGRNVFHSVMFLAASNAAHGPQPFGTLANWHYHQGGGCQIEGLLEVPQEAGPCPKGTKVYERTPEMLHVSTSGTPFSPSM